MTNLEELEALLAKATPGPLPERFWEKAPFRHEDNGSDPYLSFGFERKEDLDLFVALRNAAPAMIQELRELRAFYDEVEGKAPDTHCAHGVLTCDPCSDRWSRERRKLEAERDALRADVEGLSARLATAREALEEARHSIEHTYFCQNDSAETGCTCNALYAQNKIANALKKTTKGGGA